LTYAWLEAPLAAKLARLEEVPNWRDPAAWPTGRVFGEEGEYRWQRLADDTLHAVFLVEMGPVPSWCEASISLENGEDASFVLWGEWVDPEGDPEGNPENGPRFYAREIPEIQEYPLDPQAPLIPGVVPRLLVRRYRDPKREKGEFIRCVGFRLDLPGESGDD
jgi:hypothetical protein